MDREKMTTSILDMCMGAIKERVDYDAARVVENILDPNTDAKAKRMEMLLGHIRPAKKPDCDNVAKIICDALNGCAYKDDAQIVRCTVVKYYSETPRVEVNIQEVNHERSKTGRDPWETPAVAER